MPGFHIDQEIMEYLTKLMQPVVVVVNDNDKVMTWLTIHQLQTYLGGTGNSKARRLFFLVQSSRITASISTDMSLYACIRESAGSRSVFIVECIYVHLRSAHRTKRSFGVAVDTGIVRRLVIIATTLG